MFLTENGTDQFKKAIYYILLWSLFCECIPIFVTENAPLNTNPYSNVHQIIYLVLFND